MTESDVYKFEEFCTVDELFGQVEKTNNLKIPSGLHSLLDKAVESQTNTTIPQDMAKWSSKIAREHFGTGVEIESETDL